MNTKQSFRFVLLAFAFFTGLLVKAEQKDTVTVYFRINESVIDEQYGDNRNALQRLDSLIAGPAVTEITVKASASPDGRDAYNRKLATKRRDALKDLIARKDSLLGERVVLIPVESPKWESILQKMDKTGTQVKDDAGVKSILGRKNMGNFEKQLTLKKGKHRDAYNYIAENMLPGERYAACIVCTVERPPVDEEKEIPPVAQEEPVREMAIPVEEVKEERFRHWALSTNLVHWAALAHNLGIEYAFDSRNTLSLSGSCAWWSWLSKQKVYRWMVGELAYHHYLQDRKEPSGAFWGIYAQTGEFELMFSSRNRKGEFSAAGISGGYRWQIGRNLFMEAEAGLAYMYVDYRHALDINHVLIRQGSDHCHRILPSRISLSLVYKLNKL